jgi:hypothetical protein
VIARASFENHHGARRGMGERRSKVMDREGLGGE